MNIEITPKKTDGLERMIAVKVPIERVRDAEDTAARRYASSARLPGFRPGKAPPAIIKKKFKDAIRQQVIEDLVQAAYKEVLDREQLKVASEPHVHGLSFDEGQPLTFEIHVEVRPEVDLARTQGFRVTRPAVAITNDRVQEQLDQLRDQRATWSPVDGKPVPGDLVTVMLASADDAGVMPEGREYRIVLGAGQAITGVEELVMEIAPGGTVERMVRWPDDFPDETQRGKSKLVRVSLQEVKRKELPALDDTFAREVGDFESLDALRATVRTDLEEHARRDADSDVRQQLLDQVATANPFDVPRSWVNSLLDAYVKAYEIPEPGHDKFRDEFRPIAERQVKRDLILETIAEREKLQATESEIDDKVSEVAAKRGVDPGQVYASLQKAGRLKEIESSLTQDKVFAWLRERNEIADG
jgi:trigger factor